ncbi:MAG: S8 family peptidase [Deinococcus sp.]|nr:S8 family peptidase [Deinococcus sp.]
MRRAILVAALLALTAVSCPPLPGVLQVTPVSLVFLSSPLPFNLKALFSEPGQPPLDISGQATWSSDNLAVAVVDDDGTVIVGSDIGVAHITARFQNLEASATVSRLDATATGEFIPGQIVAQFTPGTSASAISALAEENGLALLNLLPLGGSGFCSSLLAVLEDQQNQGLEQLIIALGGDPDAEGLLRVDPKVRYGTAGFVSDPGESSPEPALVGMGNLVTQGITGQGQRIAVVDTGFDLSHPDLSGSAVGGSAINFSDEGSQNDITDLFTMSEEVIGHGTGVAALALARRNETGVVGIAPGASLIPIKACNADGECTTPAVAASICHALNQGAEVINLSLGGKQPSVLVQEAIQEALERGVVVVAAAGNEGDLGSSPHFPAAFDLPGLIAVGATENSGWFRAFFSNRGSYLDLMAPGSTVISAAPDSQYEFFDGTSFATPFVSGAAALLLSQNPGLTPAQVESTLESAATDLQSPGPDIETGWGRLNVCAALGGVLEFAETVCDLTRSAKP